MFGDFSMQAIYAKGLTSEAMIKLFDEKTSYIKFKLTVNCRNTKPICDEICTVTGYSSHNNHQNVVDGLPVNYITYSDDAEHEKKLLNVIETLIQEGVAQDKITILSPVKKINSIVNNIKTYKISEYKTTSNNTITFCSIQGFKGLENSIIILTDITSFNNRQLMYIAFSRATAGLYVIESNNAAEEYLSLQLRRLSNNGQSKRTDN
jgi:hypothetical protein